MELRMYFAILRRWFWLLSLCSVLAAVGAYLASIQQTPVYSAEAMVLLDNSKAASDSQAYSDILAGERLARTYSELMAGDEAREVVLTELGYEPEILEVVVNPQRDTTLLSAVVESNDPKAAAFIANMLPQVVGEQQRLRQTTRYATAKASLSSELDSLGSEIEDLRERVAELSAVPSANESTISRLNASLSLQEASYETLLQNFAAIRLAEAQELDVLSLVEPADVPEEPIRPRVLLNTLLAAVIGALVGMGVGFIVEYLDDTVKLTTDIAGIFGTGILALIGRIEQEGQRVLVTTMEKRSPIAEAYRMLRTNIRFAGVDEPLRTLMLTSPGPGEGKSTTTANLAVVLAQAGHHTILVDADLRRPVQHHIFNVSNRHGLTTSLVERNTSVNLYLQDTEIDGLRVLTTGPIPPNPSELLGSQRMRELIRELESLADFVIIDSAPVLAVSDTSLLASSVSGVILVLRSNSTNIEAMRRAFEQLSSAQANVIGTVLNDVRSGREGYYYYYYHQYYTSPDDPSDPGALGDSSGESSGRPKTKSPSAISLPSKMRALLLGNIMRS